MVARTKTTRKTRWAFRYDRQLLNIVPTDGPVLVVSLDISRCAISVGVWEGERDGFGRIFAVSPAVDGIDSR